MIIPVYQIVFYVFALMLVVASLMVILSRNPVQSALFLVMAFFSTSVLWMMIQAEFLSLVLIFVYVGAVMTLFLFVVMMLNIDSSIKQSGFVKFLPFAAIILVLFASLMVYVLSPEHLLSGITMPTAYPDDYSNVEAMGELLFSKYIYPLEITSAILVVSMISAIALTFNGKNPNTKSQSVAEQVAVRPEDRLRMIKTRRNS